MKKRESWNKLLKIDLEKYFVVFKYKGKVSQNHLQ